VATGSVAWDDRANPAPLETLPWQHLTRLQALAKVARTANEKRKCPGGKSPTRKEAHHKKKYLAKMPQNIV
jgi:hypothetical protein